MQKTQFIFCFPKKSKAKKNNDDFRKVVVSNKLQEKRNFCSPKKKSKIKKNDDDFRKVVIYDKMQETQFIFCLAKKKAKPKK